ncbi:MAG: COQ9 family protein [Alphaproteobacteria bacterium]|jgi:ubiquinone biosynthesis protein COQ9|nr:COQ9 family protein [Alphaproteobacteria bacterium]
MTDAEPEYLAHERRQILDAALPHVPFDGWSLATLRLAAKDAGFDESMSALAFPGGVAEVIEYWSAISDAVMVTIYAETDTESMRFRDRITFLVRTRIEAVGEHREAVRRAMTHVTRPSKTRTGIRGLYRTVDEMWYAAGDTSTDFNFYTKRGTLAGVYASTLLYWLDDASEDSAATWEFLDRRIAGVMRVPRKRANLRNVIGYVPDPKRFVRMLSERLREGRAR